MFFTRNLALPGAALLALSGAAVAGGYVAPVVDAPVIAAAPQTAASWDGLYLGGSIGYSFAADDDIGIRNPGMNAALGDVDINGATAGLHAGYRWQRGNWVYGPELWIEGGSVDDTTSTSFGDVKSELNHLIGLQLKTGYLMDPQTLVYGTVGYVHGDFDYSVAGLTEGYTADGYSVGLGVERKLRENLAVFAEWQYRNFGKTDVRFDNDLATYATPEHHNIKLGVNFSF